jgi:hypothetical protein
MRRLIRAFDGLLRQTLGVFEFSDDARGLLRLRASRAPHRLELPGHVVEAGAPVLELHLWNEHMPSIAPEGPDLAWARKTTAMFVASLHDAARYLVATPGLATIEAIGAATVLAPPGDPPGGESLVRRLGFLVLPYHSPLGRFGEFWENFYTWWIMWTYNAASLRRRSLVRMRRTEIWMSRDVFLRRYGNRPGPEPTSRPGS